jgi:GTP-binding protein SAR1
MEELTLGNINLKAYDLGGHKAARKAWKNYTPKVDGIIYLVDTTDRQRF